VLTAQSPPLTIAAKLVTATQTGRGRVIGTVGTIADTIFVGVVPNGTLSAVIDDVRIFRTDGSQMVRLSAGLSPGFGADWSPDGQLLAFDNAFGAIRVIGQNGVFRQLTRGTGSERYPKFSADGQWLYYSANTGAWAIRRVRSDGTGDELVVGTQGNEVAPAPSPDGTRMAYVLTGPDELRIRTLATGESVLLAPNGHTPAWSPGGDLIAYNVTRSGQEIFVITPSGLNSRRVSVPGVAYVLGIDWSPDGKFLIARSTLGTIDLIEVASGTTFPLTFTTGWGSPAWKQ
jgi:Tol biopolymer transport system component